MLHIHLWIFTYSSKHSDFTTTLWVALKSHHHTQANAFLLYRNMSVCTNRPVLPRACQVPSHSVQNWPKVTEFHLKLYWYQKTVQGPGQNILFSSLWSAVLSGVDFSLSRQEGEINTWKKHRKSFPTYSFPKMMAVLWATAALPLRKFSWGWNRGANLGKKILMDVSNFAPEIMFSVSKLRSPKCSHLAHHPRTDQSQQIAAERLDSATQLWTWPLKANWRNVNIVLIQSLRRYLEKCIF